jgi:hypothetical protein
MNAHTKIPPAVSVPDTEVVLAALRTTSQRLKLIDSEIIELGIALKRGLISPQQAIDWSEEIAPGCLHVVAHTLGKKI